MLVLDTNVISAAASLPPNEHIVDWLNRRPSSSLYLTATTAAEMLVGVMLMPAGRRRDALAVRIEQILDVGFRDKILPFDSGAARSYATLVVGRQQTGRTMPLADAQIAAICLVQGAQLATRNTKDFERSGVELINPWEQ